MLLQRLLPLHDVHVPVLPVALAQLNRSRAHVLPVHFFYCLCKILGIAKTDKSVSVTQADYKKRNITSKNSPFALVAPFVTNHLCLLEAWVATEGPGEHLVRNVVTEIPGEQTEVVVVPLQ